jgi:hypothetical protein
MTADLSIARQIEWQSVRPMESTIPEATTIDEWRRLRAGRSPRVRRRRARGVRTVRRLFEVKPAPCDHMHDTTTRYDPDAKQLTFLRFCPVCGVEEVVETQRYEPRFRPHRAVGQHEEPLSRAA